MPTPISQDERDSAVTVFPAGYSFDDLEIDPKMESESQEFEKFKEEMHDSQDYAKITISRQPTDTRGQPIGRKLFQCFECGVDDYTFSQLCSRIRDEYGSGLYRIQGRDSKGKFKFNKSVGIQAPKLLDDEKSENNVGSLIDKFSDAMERQQARTEAMFERIAGPQSGGDAFDQMTKMMTAMAGMMGAMGIQPIAPQAPKTLMEQLTEFKMLKELFGDNEASGGESNLYSLLGETVKAFGGPIAAALAAGQANGQLSPEGRPMLPNPTPAPEPAISDEQRKHIEAMKSQLRILVGNAKAGTDPVEFANIVVANLPENMIDRFLDTIEPEDYLEKLAVYEPEVMQHKEWFDSLRGQVLEVLTEPADDAELQTDENASSIPLSESVAGDDSGSAVEPNDSNANGDT